MSLGKGVRRAVLVLAAVAGFAAPATARMWIEPVFSDQPELGPGQAKGIVVWSHGRSVHSEDSEASSPLYLRTLREAGFDVVRFNRLRRSDTLNDSATALAARADEFRTRGYGRIVLAGQSYGAFISLMAAGATDSIDAVIGTAPAAYGSFQEAPNTWKMNAKVLYTIVERVRRARVMLAFFHGDAFDPGGRAERVESILAAKGLPHLVLDQPTDLIGHAASASGLFVRRFGACVARFAETAPQAGDPPCESQWGRRTETVAAAQASAGGAARAPFIGRWYGFYPNGREIEITVERADPQRATLVYQLGAGPEPGQAGETIRREGRLERGALVFDEPDRNRLRLELRPDGRAALTWLAREGEGRLDAVMQRIGTTTLAESR
ncbi:MAG TPA: alpha/beta hydrolase [Azospirillaceae bacterium]|nr:alpha/beta hydrolase [Azospirillaceae bacterium]